MVSVYMSRWYVRKEEEKVGKKGGYRKCLDYVCPKHKMQETL